MKRRGAAVLGRQTTGCGSELCQPRVSWCEAHNTKSLANLFVTKSQTHILHYLTSIFTHLHSQQSLTKILTSLKSLLLFKFLVCCCYILLSVSSLEPQRFLFRNLALVQTNSQQKTLSNLETISWLSLLNFAVFVCHTVCHTVIL